MTSRSHHSSSRADAFEKQLRFSSFESRVRLFICIALVCGGASASNARAQTVPESVDRGVLSSQAVTLQTVVVSGSRGEQSKGELPVTMDALTSADLEENQIRDIHDLARNLPNVSVRHAPSRFTVTGAGNSTGRDGNASFNMRGQDGNRVLMLVDGVRLPRSYINGNNAFGRDSISLDLLKRVELVYGPSSVLYGSDGLAGLVNFITFDPSDFLGTSHGSPKSLGGKLVARYGSDDEGTAIAGTVAGRAGDTLQWLVSGNARHARGIDNMGSNNSSNTDRTRPNPQTDHSGSLLGKLVWTPGTTQKHVLTVEHIQKDMVVELLSSRAKSPLVAASVVDESASQAHRRNRISWDSRFNLSSPLADVIQAVVTRQISTAQDDGQTARSDGGVRLRNTSYDERAWQANLQLSRKLSLSDRWAQKLIYGVDHAATEITSAFDGFDPAPLPRYIPKKYFPDTRDSMTGFFAQSEISDGVWRITPGVRYEHFSLRVLTQDGYSPPSPTPGKSLSGSNISPKLGALVHLTSQWSIFGNYAGGFRAPNATQINGFVENPTPTTFVRLLGNPDLKPEVSRNLEIGIRTHIDRLQLDIAAFSGRFNNLIVDKKPLGGAGVAGDPLLFQTVNVNRAKIQGFEVRGNFDWGVVAEGTLGTSVAYGQTRGADRDTGLALNSIDPAKLALGIKYERTNWDVRLDAVRHAAKSEGDLDSPYLPKPVNPPRIKQFTIPAVTTLDLHMLYRLRPGTRLNFAVVNITNRKYWLWSDVQGLAASSPVVDAYTQPGRNVRLSVAMDF